VFWHELIHLVTLVIGNLWFCLLYTFRLVDILFNHFFLFRKKCKNCKCGQDVHDVPDDDEEIRIQILFKDHANSSKFLAAKAGIS
jgi:hypothetical protein